eukprot:6959702-Prymnesium_polylepis.1
MCARSRRFSAVASASPCRRRCSLWPLDAMAASLDVGHLALELGGLPLHRQLMLLEVCHLPRDHARGERGEGVI